MTKKELVKLIREVVKIEIKSQVKRELNEAMNVMEKQVSKTKAKKVTKNYTNNPMLNEVLNDTSIGEFEDYPTMGNFKSDMRSQFMAMQGNASPATQMTDINNRPVDVSNLGDGLDKALTRDYSELVKRFK
tara:strand:+ start:8798 stop:9190 length:393 start_codon:yes stop_codon:yes gene_type:complete